MSTENEDRRVRFHNRVAKTGLIGSIAAFGSLIVLIFLPVSRSIGMIAAGVAILAMIASALVMVGGIAARDIPTWKNHRWRFSLRDLLYVLLALAMGLGGIAATARGVSPGKLLMACCGFAIAFIIANAVYIAWARIHHFKAMHAQGRYLDWDSLARSLSAGEGTLLVGKCHRVLTVWWSNRNISTPDEGRAAIESEAIITICPQQKRITQWLTATFPTVPVVELDADAKAFFS